MKNLISTKTEGMRTHYLVVKVEYALELCDTIYNLSGTVISINAGKNSRIREVWFRCSLSAQEVAEKMRIYKVRIGPVMADEMMSRLPDNLPLWCCRVGTHLATLAEVRELLEDARFNSNKKNVEVGEYGMPLATFRSYQRLVAQLESIHAAA